MSFPQGHALVIGVGSYPSAQPLNTAALTAADATTLAGVLQDVNYCGYPTNQVTLLTHAQATRQRISDALGALTTVNPQDTVLVFYSGHGEYGTDGLYYLTTYDTTLDDTKVTPGTAISEPELLTAIKAIPASRVLLIFNACHSGEISPGLLGGPESLGAEPTDIGANLPADTATALLGTGSGRVILTACREDQRSYFVKKGALTLFAQTLVAGLKGQDLLIRRNYISIFDLYEYLYEQVQKVAEERWGVDQEPEITISKGVGMMAVAAYRGKEQPGNLGLDD